jgi:hypothetical protein
MARSTCPRAWGQIPAGTPADYLVVFDSGGYLSRDDGLVARYQGCAAMPADIAAI